MVDESVSKDGPARSLANVGAAGLGSLAGLAISGPPGVIIGAIGVQTALELTGQLWDQIGHRRRLNTAIPIAYAAAQQNKPMDEVTEGLAHNPALGPITATVLMGAASTQSQDKLWAMGRVLTNILEDRARVDEEQFVASALNLMEAPHIRMLDHLDRRQTTYGRVVSQYSLESVGLGTAFSPVINALETAGLLERHSISETRNGPPSGIQLPNSAEQPKVQVIIPHWAVTDLGKLVMQRLREAAQEVAAFEAPSD